MDTQQVISIALGVGMFTLIVMVLVVLILLARKKLVASGQIDILINDKKEIHVPAGGKLLNLLADNGFYISSACGGGGTCGQCVVKVQSGGGNILPTERTHINKRDARAGCRLSCQVSVKQDMTIVVPDEVFEIKKWRCKVKSNHNVATFIKEFILELPEGENVDFKAGGFIQIEAPPHDLKYADFDIEEEYRDDWDKYNLWRFESHVTEPVVRAYSMANMSRM